VTSNHIFEREKNGKDEKKTKDLLNGGRERMELK
jgi:hypothetical protein